LRSVDSLDDCAGVKGREFDRFVDVEKRRIGPNAHLLFLIKENGESSDK